MTLKDLTFCSLDDLDKEWRFEYSVSTPQGVIRHDLGARRTNHGMSNDLKEKTSRVGRESPPTQVVAPDGQSGPNGSRFLQRLR